MDLITEYMNKNTNYSTLQQFPTLIDKKSDLPPVNNSQILKDEFLKERKKDGLFEKFYNLIKNKTHLGTGSDTVSNAIKDYETGIKTEQDVRSGIEKFRQSQKNGQQIFGDLFSVVSAAGVYFGLTNFMNKNLTFFKMNNDKFSGLIGAIFDTIAETPNGTKIKNFIKNLNKGKVAAIGAFAAMLTGGVIKSSVLKINRLTSKEFKYDKKNKPPKEERKQIKKAKRKENFKNFATGAINGLLTPVIGLAGGIAGIPIYLASNFGTRYLTADKGKNEDNKSIKDFAEKFKDNALINTAAMALMTIPLWKKNNYSKFLNKNLKIVAEKLDANKLKISDLSNTKTAYNQIQSMLLESKSISEITGSYELDTAEKIKRLTQENIFAAKFLQISGNNELSRALKENCPSTRTLEQAQSFIAKTFNEKYKVSKQLGVATIAETYLARDTETGKEVCIKILKEGISSEKIQTDKSKIAELIKSQVKDPREQQYLLKNLDDLASGIEKEVDLKNEMEAAKQIKKYTSKARVVKPVEVKDNIYVMEKANGISLETLQESIQLETEKKLYQNELSKITDNDGWGGKDYYEEKLKEIEEKIKRLKAKSPDFDLSGITDKQLKKMMLEYISVMNEQLYKIDKNGKVLHADIHPGNIFIDLDALKTGKRKFLTLIDTGNYVTFSKLQAENTLKLTKWIKTGNVKGITEYVLDGAALPDNLTKEKAAELMEKELNKAFFDYETKIDAMTTKEKNPFYDDNDNLFKLTSNIMRKYNIIPADSQLNYEKAKVAANKSFEKFLENFYGKKFSDVGDLDSRSKAEQAALAASVAKDTAQIIAYLKIQQLLQQTKNLCRAGLFRRNPNAPKTNSEEYLTYKFKQNLEVNKGREAGMS